MLPLLFSALAACANVVAGDDACGAAFRPPVGRPCAEDTSIISVLVHYVYGRLS